MKNLKKRKEEAVDAYEKLKEKYTDEDYYVVCAFLRDIGIIPGPSYIRTVILMEAYLYGE